MLLSLRCDWFSAHHKGPHPRWSAVGKRDRHSCIFNKLHPSHTLLFLSAASVRQPPGPQVSVAERHGALRVLSLLPCLPPFDSSLISLLSVSVSPSSAWRRRSSEPLTFLRAMCQSWPPLPLFTHLTARHPHPLSVFRPPTV